MNAGGSVSHRPARFFQARSDILVFAAGAV
jgi:hypothetical protein